MIGPPPEKVIGSLKECKLLQFSLIPMPLIIKAPVGRVSQWDAYELDSGTNKECHKFPVGFLFLVDFTLEQDAAHEPECSHVCQWYRCRNTWICSHTEHFSAIVNLNSLVHISPVTSLQCGVESVECGVWSGKCIVWSVECGVSSKECGV